VDVSRRKRSITDGWERRRERIDDRLADRRGPLPPGAPGAGTCDPCETHFLLRLEHEREVKRDLPTPRKSGCRPASDMNGQIGVPPEFQTMSAAMQISTSEPPPSNRVSGREPRESTETSAANRRRADGADEPSSPTTDNGGHRPTRTPTPTADKPAVDAMAPLEPGGGTWGEIAFGRWPCSPPGAVG